MDWRPANTGDLDAIDSIAETVHPGLPERADVLTEKLRLFPAGCRVLQQERRVLGYGIAHPWRLHAIPPLDSFLGALPASPDCLYIHDVAILSEGRGASALAGYVEIICRIAQAERLNYLALVSVYETHALWSRYGFDIADQSAVAEKLSSYGASARYMTRPL